MSHFGLGTAPKGTISSLFRAAKLTARLVKNAARDPVTGAVLAATVEQGRASRSRRMSLDDPVSVGPSLDRSWPLRFRSKKKFMRRRFGRRRTFRRRRLFRRRRYTRRFRW